MKIFLNIKEIEDIKNTKANSILLFMYKDSLLKFVMKNQLSFAVVVNDIKIQKIAAIYSNSLNAKYIISKKKLAKKLQKIADSILLIICMILKFWQKHRFKWRVRKIFLKMK